MRPTILLTTLLVGLLTMAPAVSANHDDCGTWTFEGLEQSDRTGGSYQAGAWKSSRGCVAVGAAAQVGGTQCMQVYSERWVGPVGYASPNSCVHYVVVDPSEAQGWIDL